MWAVLISIRSFCRVSGVSSPIFRYTAAASAFFPASSRARPSSSRACAFSPGPADSAAPVRSGALVIAFRLQRGCKPFRTGTSGLFVLAGLDGVA